MIHIARKTGSAPAALKSPAVRRALAAAETFYRQSARARRQRRHDVWQTSLHEPVADALDKLFLGKCAYCESPADRRMKGCIDHYRPRRSRWPS